MQAVLSASADWAAMGLFELDLRRNPGLLEYTERARAPRGACTDHLTHTARAPAPAPARHKAMVLHMGKTSVAAHDNAEDGPPPEVEMIGAKFDQDFTKFTVRPLCEGP